MDKKNVIIIILIFLTIIAFSLFAVEKMKNIKLENRTGFSYLISKPDPTMDSGLNDFKQILTFDENDICIDNRILFNFKEESTAQEQYDIYVSSNESDSLFNIQKNGKIVVFNTKNLIGTQKEDFSLDNFEEI